MCEPGNLTRREIMRELFPGKPVTHYCTTWADLQKEGYITRNKKIYSVTEKGKILLEHIKTNDVIYNLIKGFLPQNEIKGDILATFLLSNSVENITEENLASAISLFKKMAKDKSNKEWLNFWLRRFNTALKNGLKEFIPESMIEEIKKISKTK
jgi:DNA-binding PadR family transcriptional regulator